MQKGASAVSDCIRLPYPIHERIFMKEIGTLIKRLKRELLVSAAKAGEGHIASAFSILDILWILYDCVLDVDPRDPEKPNRDRFILSKGHAALGHYVVLAEKGFFPKTEIETFGRFESRLGGHPDRNKVPGVEASTGSLGHGFPIAVGVTMGLKITKKPCKVFALVGDGECNEGTMWESALLASHHGLKNLCCIVDYNHSTDRAMQMGNLGDKFGSFGWDSCHIDGHDHEQIYQALSDFPKDRPVVIIAETIKGFGCRRMENNPEWHHKAPSSQELDEMIEELR